MSLVQRHDPVALANPVMVVLLDGWVDAGRTFDRLGRTLLTGAPLLVADVDVDMLVDYRSRRPVMRVEDGVNTGLDWPRIELLATRDLNGRDVLVLQGVEPDRGWRTFAREVVDLAQDLAVRMVVTLGAYPAATPHTRAVQLSAMGTTPALIARIGRVEGRTESPAGAHAAIERECARRRIPSVGLWAPVPHYAASDSFPPAAIALLEGLAAIADRHFDVDALIGESVAVLERLDTSMARDHDRARMVGALELHADEVASVQLDRLPSGDQLFEQLRAMLDEGRRRRRARNRLREAGPAGTAVPSEPGSSGR